MKLVVFLLFCLFIYAEFSVFVWIANETSVFSAMLLGLLTTFGGIALVKRQGVANIKNLQQRMINQENRSFEAINTLFILLAGALLLIPGFITDALGLLLLIPFVQRFCYGKLRDKFTVSGKFYRKTDEDIIDAEFYRKEDNDKISFKRDDER